MLERGRVVKGQGLARYRVSEAEVAGVELELPRACAPSVERIAHDRDAEAEFVSCVDAKLVGAARDGCKGDARDPTRDGKSLPVCDPHLPLERVVDLHADLTIARTQDSALENLTTGETEAWAGPTPDADKGPQLVRLYQSGADPFPGTRKASAFETNWAPPASESE